ncbi:MAG TPA: hydroxysqualene dehydroxylase HpnE [Burkholderiaceae bacterium]|nr:hydroxysqualene dehydroxylase HpnE [Burkholderiaceae bacterium]
MKLAIVGAGWAGLAAAVEAADGGHQVTVFESAHTLGGRARRVERPWMGITLDNGQHILLSAYRHTLALMQRLGQNPDARFQRLKLNLQALDGRYRLTLANAPAPWHLVGGLLRAQGLCWQDKWQLARAMQHMQRRGWQVAPAGITLHDWLDRHCPSAVLYQHFWQPLCLAAMNTPVEHACAQLFANVLRDSLGHSREACDMLLPRTDLSDLWPDHVRQTTWHHAGGSVNIRTGHTVRNIQTADATSGHALRVEDEHFDGLILACSPPSCTRLLNAITVPDGAETTASKLLATLGAFDFNPIATLTLVLEQPWALPAPMLMLREQREREHFGQWLFNWPDFRPDSQRPVLQIVISDAAQAAHLGAPRVYEGVMAQLRAQTASSCPPMPAVIDYRMIVEKRATFTARAGLARPDNTTPWPGVWLAGDWTDTGYPGVLEGAVRSGQQAARAAMQGT